ncbi:MAG: RDD family protein [Proteobacteria bacterium]|nr:RDD family protein [Pseudomonadota bacterium]
MSGASLPTAPLKRRLAAFVYEGVLLFGIVMMAGLLFSAATNLRDPQNGTLGLQLLLFALIGLYFTWTWTHGGQTVAMQTWRIRLLRTDGNPLRWPQALARYLLAWLWFVPALVTLKVLGVHGGGMMAAVVLAGVAAYAALTRLHPDRQFWHDAVCGTRLVSTR